jgi:hypothetical protein
MDREGDGFEFIFIYLEDVLVACRDMKIACDSCAEASEEVL